MAVIFSRVKVKISLSRQEVSESNIITIRSFFNGALDELYNKEQQCAVQCASGITS